jgi:hypothetical protein
MNERGKPMDKERGLYSKYRVMKRDTGEELDGPCFVLRPDRDVAAMRALYRYAELTSDNQLREDLERWLDSMDVPTAQAAED